MARVRIMEYGPSVKGGSSRGRAGRITTSNLTKSGRNGVIMRQSIGNRLGDESTTKSKLMPKVIKGIRPPGYQAPNYSSPNN